jgi:4-amino-4-deoxy-L-arabinose transferase-like glycosyltransferase
MSAVIKKAVLKEMVETRNSSAIPSGDVRPGMGLLTPPPKYLIVTLLLAGLLVNAVMVLVVLPRLAHALNYSLSLGDLYDQIAKSLDEGHGYRVEPNMGKTMLREPVYPLLIAAVFKVSGYGDQGPRCFCILLAFASALMLLRLTQKITGDGVIALTAALLFLLYPWSLIAEARAGNEMPCILGMLLFMLLLYRAAEEGRLLLFGVAGLLLGATTLVRSEVLLFPLFLLPYFLIASKDWEGRGKALLRIAVLAAGAVTVMSPWIVRNYLLVHKFVPTATLSGVAAQEGLYTCEHLPQYGSFMLAQRGAGLERAEIARQLGLPFEGSYYYQVFYTPQDEVKFNSTLLQRVSQEYRRDPGVLVGCSARNLVFKFWFLGKTPTVTRMNMLVQLPLLAVALGGFIVLGKRGLLVKMAVILLYLLYVPMVHAGIIAHARHSMLIAPFLFIPAAVFLAWTWQAVQMKYRRPQPCGPYPA